MKKKQTIKKNKKTLSPTLWLLRGNLSQARPLQRERSDPPPGAGPSPGLALGLVYSIMPSNKQCLSKCTVELNCCCLHWISHIQMRVHSIYLMGYWHILQCFSTENQRKGFVIWPCVCAKCAWHTHTLRGETCGMLCMDLWQTVSMETVRMAVSGGLEGLVGLRGGRGRGWQWATLWRDDWKFPPPADVCVWQRGPKGLWLEGGKRGPNGLLAAGVRGSVHTEPLNLKKHLFDLMDTWSSSEISDFTCSCSQSRSTHASNVE